MSFIIIWNIARLLVRPKNMTRGLNRPQFVWNATFPSSPSLILTLLYPHWMSSLVKFFALASDTLLNQESEVGGECSSWSSHWAFDRIVWGRGFCLSSWWRQVMPLETWTGICVSFWGYHWGSHPIAFDELEPGGRPLCWMSESWGQVLSHGPTSSSLGANPRIPCQKHI